MMSCYLDEAGGMQDRFTVVSAWLSTAARWERFETDWRLMLASYNLEYFHMAEFSQSAKIFKKWKDCDGIRKRFVHDATEIIRTTVEYGFLVYSHHQIFEAMDKRFGLSEMLSSPYAVAGRSCVAQVEKWKYVSGSSDEIGFVFEDGGPDKSGLLRAMDVPRKLPAPTFMPSRDIKDRKTDRVRSGVIQLQAADFMAYELRKHRTEFANRSGRPPRISLHEILKVPIIAMASFNAENAQEVCQLESALPLR
jgi:hypothetical protein